MTRKIKPYKPPQKAAPARKVKAPKQAFRTTMTEVFDLPEELTLDLPRITLIGNLRLEVENHKGLVDYTSEGIKVRVVGGYLWSRGDNLILRNISSDEIRLEGTIKEVGILLDREEE